MFIEWTDSRYFSKMKFDTEPTKQLKSAVQEVVDAGEPKSLLSPKQRLFAKMFGDGKTK
ncbi:hypothetical protein AJ79_03502 [Helicocarpus griseus UAMH5409]|uniref:Uncharacterized protein n=1 Tax=Helicocarpus griseus UAMH5409 TaxID=1447875 RepID=A0A2B7XPE6_9EURO|nr:hypothetical protein AJ79_03502 [Helicocarpus griseus UAMH5409]